MSPTEEIAASRTAVEVRDLHWQAIRTAVDPKPIRARMRTAVEHMVVLLDHATGPGMLFDRDRDRAHDAARAIRVTTWEDGPLWIIGDLHGDLRALEASLAQIGRHASLTGHGPPRIVFLGDFFDDEGLGIELLVRLFALIVDAPQQICVIAGNHDEALSYDRRHFASSVSPSDFSDFLNANLAHEWIERAGKVAVRLIANAPRALFFPDGLLVAHGGFPLSDLHASHEAKGSALRRADATRASLASCSCSRPECAPGDMSDWAQPSVGQGIGCLARLALIALVLLVAVVIAVFLHGRSLTS